MTDITVEDELVEMMAIPFSQRDTAWTERVGDLIAKLPVRTPTLGEMADVMRDWKARGVGLESVQWVATEQVWYGENE